MAPLRRRPRLELVDVKADGSYSSPADAAIHFANFARKTGSVVSARSDDGGLDTLFARSFRAKLRRILVEEAKAGDYTLAGLILCDEFGSVPQAYRKEAS